ncbi:MAG: hypothetical protein KA716_32120 [Gloeotrichia echinulata DEX184]|jgi:hypothetical protein|nr:hypothetical protein [Gloeotrichia echinulata DEX184]
MNLPRRRFLKLFATGAVLGYGLNYGFNHLRPKASSPTPIPYQVTHNQSTDYERLKIGMSIAEVIAILDSNWTEVDRTATTRTLEWAYPNNSKIVTIFEHDQLKNKKQLSSAA